MFVSAWVRSVTRSVGMDVLRSLLQFSAPVVIRMSSLGYDNWLSTNAECDCVI